ncbi:DUF1272 domain-containing protein [Kangiella koreensis]|uniref:Urease-associated protein n=1 Tax=Kangiella koreensis (strain DSM 16069 / JCM 12317 / KCTC 12182 / SW-125) TaxID=523791 RepID=C7RAM2_KANKD|nr:protein of unknown function DUF1272 [Kangiella koreensis DSM 16069]
MLELRPTCENCRKSLPPDSTDAMICTYECTFCRDCVENILENVCPNCGGGFVPRPIRPKTAYLENVSLQHQPAGNREVYSPVSKEAHSKLIEQLADVPPEQR